MKHFSARPRPKFDKNRLIIGRKPLVEALSEGKEIDKIFLLKTASGTDIDLIKKTANERQIPISKVPIEKLNRFSKSNHQGIIALAGLISFQPLQEIISQVIEKGETPFIVVSDGITDTRNLGALARSAFCFGAHALAIPATNNASITEDSLKASAGALEHLPVCRLNTIEEIFETLYLNGIQTIAGVMSGSIPIKDIDLKIPIAIILGAEDKGISTFATKKSNYMTRIPMSGQFNSLNVAVAGGILFYEVFNQRNVVSKI